MKFSRRLVLRGLGGVVLGLPFLESIGNSAPARADADSSFAIFFRQGNGVAAAQNTTIGSEPERFWANAEGPLTAATTDGRTLAELAPFHDRILAVRNVNMGGFNYGDGHARGALQCLTARGPTVQDAGGNSEAAGQSIDHYLGEALNDSGESWFMLAGRNSGWLGGACISYRSSGVRHSVRHNPYEAYMNLIGAGEGLSLEAQQQLAQRGQSVNDLVRSQLVRLQSQDLSTKDRQRIDLHLQSVRDVEVRLGCMLNDSERAALEGVGTIYESTDGDEVLAAARLHMDVAALAVACGATRSVAIQVGSGNDGATRYYEDSGAQMENFHYISHRRLSHGSDGTVISNADQLHAMVDRQFARTFRHLLEKLDSYPMPSGATLLDCGLACWLNDLGNGPGHSRLNVPWIIAGSAAGATRTGAQIELSSGERVDNHAQLLNTIATAVGVPTNDFGDPSLPGGTLSEILV